MFCGVAAIRKRLLTVYLALAFFVGAPVQMLPSSLLLALTCP
jgi:hypothetical protein